jgi:CrcB protein
MNAFIVIGIGGACGSIARYAISTWMNGSTGLFPVGTFIVNTLGCFILGFLFSYSEQKLSDTLYKGKITISSKLFYILLLASSLD